MPPLDESGKMVHDKDMDDEQKLIPLEGPCWQPNYFESGGRSREEMEAELATSHCDCDQFPRYHHPRECWYTR